MLQITYIIIGLGFLFFCLYGYVKRRVQLSCSISVYTIKIQTCWVKRKSTLLKFKETISIFDRSDMLTIWDETWIVVLNIRCRFSGYVIFLCKTINTVTSTSRPIKIFLNIGSFIFDNHIGSKRAIICYYFTIFFPIFSIRLHWRTHYLFWLWIHSQIIQRYSS